MITLATPVKQYLLLLCAVMLTCSVALAQGKKQVATTQIPSSLKGNNAYYYPEFKKGKVTFITGTSSSGLLNYSTQNQEIEFITSKKDTLSFTDMYLIEMITIENDVFYYDNRQASLLKLMDSINGHKLLVKELPLSSKQSNNSTARGKQYFMGSQHTFVPVTTESFLSAFPTHADALKNYIATNNLQLKSESDIKKLLQYASGL